MRAEFGFLGIRRLRAKTQELTTENWQLATDHWQLMLHMLRFLWNSTRGHHLAPWRSPYLLWRIETYTGVKMTQIGFLEFWEFLWTERANLWRFLKWTAEMDGYVHPKAKKA
jgi:hypothetical protein